MKMMDKKVSILVPIYNAASYLFRCVDSLLAQTYSNVEIIFADDGSRDASMEVLEQCLLIGSKEHAVTTKVLHSLQNRGIAATRNALLNAATGDYILFVDSDDYISPLAVERLVAIAEREGADIVRQKYYEIPMEGRELGAPKGDDVWDLHSIIAGSDNVDAMWQLLIRRSLIEEHHLRFPDDINVCEDWIMSIKLCYYSHKAVTTDEAYYYYERGNATSLTSRRQYANEHGLRAIDHIYRFLNDEGIYDRYREDFLFRAFKWKQSLLISRDLFDPDRYVAFFPESNTYWRRLTYGHRERLLFFLAEHKLLPLIKLICRR